MSANKVPPWKRPELGEWINNRAPEFDQILFWKLDRFVRRISDLHLMIEWCKEYGKVLAADKDPIDLDSAYGEMMVTMIAGMARIEAANTGVRLESLWKYARTTERAAVAAGVAADELGAGQLVEVVLDVDRGVLSPQSSPAMMAGLSRKRPWSSAWVKRPKQVRSAVTLTSANDSLVKASGLMVRILAMVSGPRTQRAAVAPYSG